MTTCDWYEFFTWTDIVCDLVYRQLPTSYGILVQVACRCEVISIPPAPMFLA